MRRIRSRWLAAALLALTSLGTHASAGELIGKVKSVDIEGKKVVVTEKATEKDSEITVGTGTSWYNEKKAKFTKKFELSKLKVGSEVEVTHEGAMASKVIIKPGKKKKAKA